MAPRQHKVSQSSSFSKQSHPTFANTEAVVGPTSAKKYFELENRQRVRDENPAMSADDMSAELDRRWAQIGDRTPYEMKAQADRERYDRELQALGFTGDTPTARQQKRKRPTTKDPDAPKKPRTSYLFFVQEKMQKAKEENPYMKPQELMKLLGDKWRLISVEEKEKYVKMAGAEKERFEAQLARYRAGVLAEPPTPPSQSPLPEQPQPSAPLPEAK